METTTNPFFEQFTRPGAPNLIQDKIGFINEGYWRGIENSVELAQINLIETLAGFLINRDGNVLDVACGRGASSKFLTKYFDPRSVTGIEASERYLEICRLSAPDCDFRLMDAVTLEFDDSSFDNVLCMEAAYHFTTRERFLKETYRVLRSGGRFAVSDFFVRDSEHNRFLQRQERLRFRWPKESWPKENCLENLDAYREKLLRIGFRHVRAEDITQFKELPFRQYCIRKAEREQDYKTLDMLMADEPLGTHCIVFAIK